MKPFKLDASFSVAGISLAVILTVFTLSVPYRNSVLTMLLKNALGGNSKTIMVCNLRFSMFDESAKVIHVACFQRLILE